MKAPSKETISNVSFHLCGGILVMFIFTASGHILMGQMSLWTGVILIAVACYALELIQRTVDKFLDRLYNDPVSSSLPNSWAVYQGGMGSARATG